VASAGIKNSLKSLLATSVGLDPLAPEAQKASFSPIQSAAQPSVPSKVPPVVQHVPPTVKLGKSDAV